MIIATKRQGNCVGAECCVNFVEFMSFMLRNRTSDVKNIWCDVLKHWTHKPIKLIEWSFYVDLFNHKRFFSYLCKAKVLLWKEDIH